MPDPILEAISQFITLEHPNWNGTATELVAQIGTDIPINAITKRLNVNAGRLLNEYGILYQCSRTHEGRKLELRLLNAPP